MGYLCLLSAIVAENTDKSPWSKDEIWQKNKNAEKKKAKQGRR